MGSTSMFCTPKGKLQRQLHKGEYDLFKHAPIFESDFIQITRRGELVDVHNRMQMVTLGIAYTNPLLQLPDIMLMARPAPLGSNDGQSKAKKRPGAKALELTRLVPLCFVRISVHSAEKQQLRLKFATGRSCYLQLSPALGSQNGQFAHWEKLVYLLRPPVDYGSSTYAIPATDLEGKPLLEGKEHQSPGPADFQGPGEPDQVSVRSVHGASDVAGATSAGFFGGEVTRPDSCQPVTGSWVATLDVKPMGLDPDSMERSLLEDTAAIALDNLDRQSVATPSATIQSQRGSKTPLVGTVPKSPDDCQLTTAGPESGCQAVVETTNDTEDLGKEPLFSLLPQEEEQEVIKVMARSLHTPNQASSNKRRQQEGKDEDRPGDSGQQPPETCQKENADLAPQKPTKSRSMASHRATREDKKERVRGSPGSTKRGDTHKGISHAPITKESRAAHKSSRSLATSSSGATSKRLGRIGAFLRGLTSRTVAASHASTMELLTTSEEESGTTEVMSKVSKDAPEETKPTVKDSITKTMALEGDP